MNVSESNAVFTLLRWIGHDPMPWMLKAGVPADRVSDADAEEALAFLAERAGRTLQIGVRPAEVAGAVDRHAGRLRAADSDGLAQAVCRALAGHASKGGAIPWPSVRGPFEEWEAAQGAERAELDGGGS